MTPINFSWSSRQPEPAEAMDSLTYYDTKKEESLRNKYSQTIRWGNKDRWEEYNVHGLDMDEQKDFYNRLCKKICYEYRQNGTSPFVKAMQEDFDQRAERGLTLSPFEISVLREAKKRLDSGCYEGINMRDFQSSVYIPHIHERNECVWYDKSIHEPWTQRKIARLEIFDLENSYRSKMNAMNNRASMAETPAVSNQSQATGFSAAATDSAELAKAQARIKELEAKIQQLHKANESEREAVINRANEEAAMIKTDAEKIKEKATEEAKEKAKEIVALAEEEARTIKEKATKEAAEAEEKAKTVFKNKLSKQILAQRTKTRDTNIEEIKGDLKKYYAKPSDLSKNSACIVKSANEFQSLFSTAINAAIEKLKEEKTQIYEQIDQLKHDMYPSKEKLCVELYREYCGTWNKTGDNVISALLATIEANRENGTDVDPDGKIVGNLIKLSGMLEKFMVEFENAIAALGYEIFRPEPGDRYDSNEHRDPDQSDGDDTDEFNGRRIVACKKPGVKRIGLSGATEVLEFAEVTVED